MPPFQDGIIMRGAVLAGGLATRFAGEPKGLQRVGGRRILDRVVETLAAATGTAPILVSSAAGASGWRPDLQVVPDAFPSGGTLTGLYSALNAAGGDVLVLGWDMPFIPVGLLKALMDGSLSHDAFLPESGGPRGVEPLCAVYRPACLEPMRQSLEAGDQRAVAFHHAVRVGILPREAVATFGPPEHLFFNVNAPDDLERAESLCPRRV
jgi:molybdopterin-guanine dinucleotide biosynthesis protein A